MIFSLKRGLLFVFSCLFIVSFSNLISADVISINSGGSTEFVVTTDKYIDSFFFGIPDAVILGCTDPTANNYNPSATQDDGSCTFDGDTGGGGGGGAVPSLDITVTPSWDPNSGIKIPVDTTREENITVTNNGDSTVTVSISHTFGDHLTVLDSQGTLTIEPGESEIFNLLFLGLSEPGVVPGSITVGDRTILTSLDISTVLLLFDSLITVLNPNITVFQGEELNTLINLIPMGDPARLDVTMEFEIRDFDGNVYSTSSDTVLIESQMSVLRDFETGNLPVGDYIIALDLVYPNGIAPSSAHFIVKEREIPPIIGDIILFLIIVILVLAIIIIIILILRRRDDDEEKSQQQVFSGQ